MEDPSIRIDICLNVAHTIRELIMRREMPTRSLGRTGLEVSIIGLGGFHLGKPAEERTSIRIIRKAIDEGVTFLDNAWCYHDGRSEI